MKRQEESAKDHERCRRAGVGCITSTLADDGCHVVIGLVLSDDMKSMPHAQNLRGTVCSQLLGDHASTTHCDTVCYTVGKGKTSMLKTLRAFRGYQTGWGRRVFHMQ